MARPATATIVGAGPAGLMAAELLSAGGVAVTVLERMPSVGRKFLMAGRGGLNLTHSEPLDAFAARYGEASGWMRPMLDAVTPADLRIWADGLDQETFVGPSGRIFPKAMKASPLLRGWLARLAAQGVEIRTRSEWHGQADADVTVLALGGASWPRLGADGGWTRMLAARGVEITPLAPANSGANVAWSDIFRDRFEGQPLHNLALSAGGLTARGEAVVTRYGLEGGPLYALSSALRGGGALTLDLRPDLTVEALTTRLSRPRGGQSMANFLRKAANLSPLEINLLREAGGLPSEPAEIAAKLKAMSLAVTGVQGLDRAISTAGGVARSAVDEGLMLKAWPGVYGVGEMLDWEAPTGGYLLQGCFATAAWAARSILAA
jgi:uncharacterized flavoprotein (TIGR03862 family)